MGQRPLTDLSCHTTLHCAQETRHPGPIYRRRA